MVFASPLASSLLQGEVTLKRPLAQAQWILREQARARGKLLIICCLSICHISSWGWSWGNSEAIKHAVRHGLGSAAFHDGSLLNSLRPNAG